MSFGLSFATLFTTGWYVMGEISFLRPYSTFAWELYGVRSLFIATAFSVGVMWVFYTIAHALSLSDVGSRIDVLDRAIRDGRIGDSELQDALQREESGEYHS